MRSFATAPFFGLREHGFHRSHGTADQFRTSDSPYSAVRPFPPCSARWRDHAILHPCVVCRIVDVPSIVDCRVRYCSLPIERSNSGCRTGNARRNIVSTVNMGCPLNLKQIAMGARNAEFNPKVRYSLTVATDLSLRKQSTNLPSSPVWRYVLEYLAAICRGDHAHPGTQDNGADIRLGQNGTPLMRQHLWATIIYYG